VPTDVSQAAGELRLLRGGLDVRVRLAPFAFEVRRGTNAGGFASAGTGGRRIVREGGARVWDGAVHDQFIALTEGVIAHEDREPPETVASAAPVEMLADGAELALRLEGGRRARLRITVPTAGLVALELSADGDPLRLALDWHAEAGEAFAGLGARHHPSVDHAGREIQLGADRRYTGPDCPPDLLASGGIPQGDCAPAPWLASSHGWSAWIDGAGNGIRAELGERTTLSARASGGPLRVVLYTDPSPAARLRRWLAHVGLPALLPEWGYGFWKSRDVYEHRDDVEDDVHGCAREGIPLDAVVLDSPWETQYNTWEPNPHQLPDFDGMVAAFRAQGVRTVVWITPWINLDSSEGQIPPDPGSQALHAQPAPTYEEGVREGHFLRAGDGEPFVARWWMGTGSPVDLASPPAEAWWCGQARALLARGVEGIKADDGEGYYLPEEVRLADGRTGASAAWAHGTAYRSAMQRALDDVHPGRGVLFGRSGWTGQQALGHLWGGDQSSDPWALQVLIAAGISAASTGFSNWSHDVGGYLGHRLVERCPAELLVRWAQYGCFTPLMHAHARMRQEPWTYDYRTLDLYRSYVLLHERLVPYIRSAAATAARCGLPIVRPLSLLQPDDAGAWSVGDAFAFGPALWVAPVVEDGAREREVVLPRGRWIETWSGREVVGGREVVAPAPLERIPVWVRAGSVVVTLPAEHVASGLGDTPEARRPLEATLWGEPACGRAAARLADGARVRWVRGEWSVEPEREIATRVVG
jgi:hypothetical protein